MLRTVGANCDSEPMATVGDNPIKHAEQDLLHRGIGAANTALGIRDVDASGGYVVGVVGP